jgi:hypothetical protein
MPTVAIATCREVPDLDDEGRLLLEALRAAGVDARPAIWDQQCQWDTFSAVLIRSTWDYFRSISQFLAWADLIGPRLHNPAAMVRWNYDKRYLLDLARARIPVVDTTYLAPGTSFTLPAGQFVVKPAISAGSNDTATYDGARSGAALDHIQRLHSAGRTVLLQPYFHSIGNDGETAVIVIDGEISHCMRKEPLLSLDQPAGHELWRPEEMSLRLPDVGMVELARRVVSLVSAWLGVPLYLRVDMLRDVAGQWRVLEVELIEPSLFLQFCPGSATRLAETFARRLLLRC